MAILVSISECDIFRITAGRFPPIHVAPEGSPTGFHSADLAET